MSFHQKIDQLNLNSTYDEAFFNQSLLEIPEVFNEKPKQIATIRKNFRRRAYKRNTKKLNKSIWDNIVSVFLTNTEAKKKGGDLMHGGFIHRPK